MGEKMTLEQVRDWAANTPASNGWQAKVRDEAVAAIRAHLMSQDAEIERLSQESAQQFIRARDWAELSGKNEDRASLAESRLAAANALLSRCFVQIGELTKGLDPHDPIYVELQQLGLDWMQHSEADTDHLSENTHDRA